MIGLYKHQSSAAPITDFAFDGFGAWAIIYSPMEHRLFEEPLENRESPSRQMEEIVDHETATALEAKPNHGEFGRGSAPALHADDECPAEDLVNQVCVLNLSIAVKIRNRMSDRSAALNECDWQSFDDCIGQTSLLGEQMAQRIEEPG